MGGSPQTVANDYAKYLLTLLFYVICWPIGRAALTIDRLTGRRSLEFLLSLTEAVDEGRFP